MNRITNFLATTKHKFWVAYYIMLACFCLVRRAFVHDLSKYSEYEEPFFSRAIQNMKGLAYGSPEYKASLANMRPALLHHYYHNSHHPEHYIEGVKDMSPLDQIEMLCDWKAAGRRHATGAMKKSLETNLERFEIPSGQWVGLVRDSREIGLVKGENVNVWSVQDKLAKKKGVTV